jgi:hypothetical protein
MGTITLEKVRNNVRALLQDENSLRWTNTEIGTWTDDALTEIALLNPGTYKKNVNVKISAAKGSLQTLSTWMLGTNPKALFLISVDASAAANGVLSTAKTMRRLDRRLLDDQKPGWHSELGTPTIWCYSANIPDTFWIYPCLPTSSSTTPVARPELWVTYASLPALSDLNDNFLPAIVNYVCHRCYLNENEFNTDPNRSMKYYEDFVKEVTGEEVTTFNFFKEKFEANKRAVKSVQVD